jgi:starch phosphorylase
MNLGAFLPRALPEGLEPLTELALDLRWTWSHEADGLWHALDPGSFEAHRNPWVTLQSAPAARLQQLARDEEFRRELGAIVEQRNRYLSGAASPDAPGIGLARPVAYFSMEYGLGDGVPLYAGGLGVLAADHMKAASDLGVPLCAVGLLYQEGYFRQRLDADGHQEELYPYNDPTALPIQPVLADSGGWLLVPLDLPGRTVRLRAWRATVGRVVLYLLDSNVAFNDPFDRGITGKLYGEGLETRLLQEIALGIGGWRLLEALHVDVGACHFNEGHTAFVVLERARSLMRAGSLPFSSALWATRAGNVFTTHTSVAAAMDAYPPALLARYFPDGRGYLAGLGIGLGDLLALGRAHPDDGDEPWRPIHLAIRGAGRVNGVSRLHGETSRRILEPLFPRWPVAEVPVGHVTNGVHMPSWDSRFTDELWTVACGRDRWRGAVDGLETAAADVDDRELWTVRGRARDELVRRSRQRLVRQLGHRGASEQALAGVETILDPDVLTLGFARRFATYKRPNLLLTDPDRLRRLLGDARRPVQLVVAGKAHPADGEGKALIRAWTRFVAEGGAVRARCVFLEDYDLALAQDLVSGVDVWINTPRRPWEACGTSGMKVLVNGGLNLSVLDGWWAEAWAPDVGWYIGDTGSDAGDAESLFRVLEDEVVPLFYERDADGLPRRWIQRVRASLSRLTPRFSANRMLREYVERCYLPAERELLVRSADGGARAAALDAWARRVAGHWSSLRFGRMDVQERGGQWEITVEAYLDDLDLDDVTVELYADPDGAEGPVERVGMKALRMLAGTTHGHLFGATLPKAGRPPSHYTPRITPSGAHAAIPLELPLIAWLR